ncbi:MAG TPA: hypothetical protein VGU01_02440 [Sphingomicrobium sp.]|nr:hypothetical protein [Sphingomicrobium sp.]
MADAPLEERVAACERANSRLRKVIIVQAVLWPLAAFLLIGGSAMANRQHSQALSLTVKEVAVVDASGVVRARLGGDLPDARYPDGHVSKRGSKAAGLLIYDEQGIERGGYVTQDTGSNAMLTLDSKSHQAALFVAGPDPEQASALQLWRPGSAIELRSDPAGSRLSVSDASGVVLQQPILSAMPHDDCAGYREVTDREKGMHFCRARFGETLCHKCLDGALTQ